MNAVWVLTGLLGAAAAGWVVMERCGDWRTRLPLSLGCAYVALGVGSVVLAQQGVFRPPSFAGLGAVALTAALLWVGFSFEQEASGRATTLLWGAALLTLAILAGSPVMDMRMEASDPGTYSLAAARLAQTGGIAMEEEFLASLDPRSLRALFPEATETSLSSARSMGFYLDDHDTARVVPQFLPIAFVWMAVARWALDPSAASWAGIGALWLGALAMFSLLWRTAGRFAAIAGSVLLASNFVAIWFARRAAAEPFAIALIAIFAAAWVQLEERDDSRVGLLAGVALSLTWLCKLELLLLVAPLAALFVHDLLSGDLGRRGRRAFWGGIWGGGALFFFHAWGWARPYVRDVLLVPGLDLQTVTLVAVAAAVIGASLWVVAARRGYPRWELLPDGVPDSLVVVVIVFVLAAVVHGLTLRPLAGGWDADNMLLVSWMLMPSGLALAVLGLTVTLWKRPGGGVEALLFIFLTVAAIVLWNKQIRPHLLWAFRRLLPVVLPVGIWMIGVSVGLSYRRLTSLFGSAGKGSRATRLTSGAFALVVPLLFVATVWGGAQQLLFYRQFEDLTGSDRIVSLIERLLPESAVMIVEPRTRRGLLRFEGMVLHELSHPVLRMRGPELDQPVLREVLQNQWKRGRRTFLLTSGRVQDSPRIQLVPVEKLEWRTSRLADARRALPTSAEPMFIQARLYELVPQTRRDELDGRLDVGSWDDPFLDDSTFHEIEFQDERDFRWTRETGRIWLPPLEPEDDLALLRLASAYPPELGAQWVNVFMNGREVARLQVRRGWRDYEVSLAGSVSHREMNTLELVAEPPFVPVEPDREIPRTVGVAVDLVRWGASTR